MPEEQEITISDNHKSEKGKRPKKKSFLNRLFKLFIYILSSLLILIIIFLVLLQTSFFKNKILSFALNEINKNLSEKESILAIDNIEGNLFNGIRINNISLIVKSDTLFKSNSIEVSYNLIPLLDNKVLIKNIQIEKPQINLTNVKDKKDSLIWNLTYLLQSEKPKDTTKKEFEWEININKLIIDNSSVRILSDKPSNIPVRQIYMNKLQHFDLDYLDVNNLNIELSCRYKKNEIFADIKNVSFKTNSEFNLNKLTLNARLDDDSTAHLSDLSLMTDKSSINIPKININNFDLFNFNYKELGKCVTDGHISTDRFDFSDLYFFLPDLDFIKGKYFLDLIFKGKYADLEIDKLIARTSNSYIDVFGKVKNLNFPENLEIDAKAKNCILDPNDSKINFPGLPIPDYSHLGIVNASLLFRGNVKRFYGEYDVNSSAGDISGKTYLDISHEIIYRSENSLNGFNLGKLFKNKELESYISGTLSAKGSGTNYRKLSSDIIYNIYNSKIYNQNISRSFGTIKANNGNYILDINYSGNNVNTIFSGNVNISDINNISYNLKGNAKNLNLAGITKQQNDNSNLNFEFDLNGKGTDVDIVNGSFNFNIFPSQYQSFIIPETNLRINMSGGSTEKNLDITSNILDVKAKGIYSYKTFPKIISDNLNNISTSIKKQLGLVDSNVNITDNITVKNSYGDVDFEYSMKLKNFVPLNIAINDNKLKLKADISGKIKNNSNTFSFSADGEVTDLSLNDSLALMKKALIKLDINNDYNKESPNNIYADLYFKTDNLKYGKFVNDTLDIRVGLENYKNNFYIKTNIDSIRLLTNGQIAFKEKETNFIFDTLRFGYRNFKLNNSEPLVLSYKITDSSNYIDFQKFSISEDKQKIDVNGYYSFNSNSKISLIANDISISDLSKSNLFNIFNKNIVNGNIKNLKIKYEGSLKDPNLMVEIYTDNIKFDTNSIGYLYAIVKYKDNLLTPDIVLIDPVTNGKLLVNGKIPIENPLLNDSASFDILNNPVYLDIKADSVQITLLEQNIPLISDLHGILKGVLNIRGIVKQPIFTGNMNIRNGSFFVSLNGLKYDFDLDVATDNERLIVNNTRLYYPEETDKFITFDGYLDFLNLKLNKLSFDLLGDIKVLDSKVIKNDLEIYGDLYAGSGNPILTISGNSDQILLSGNFLLKKGKLLMSTNQNKAFHLYDDNFRYTVSIDSSSFSKDSLKLIYAYYNDTLPKREDYTLNPFDKALAVKDTLSKKTSSQNLKFIYDISITSLNSIFVNFIVDEQTKQEFNGEVKTSLYLDNKNNDLLELRGRVDLLQNCYYKFYKVFNVTGYIVFNGNPVNPDLFLTAEYNGKSPDPNNSLNTRDVLIKFGVSGNASNPKLVWAVNVNGSSLGGGDQTDQALSFIVFGKFKDELSASQRTNLFSSIGANVGTNIVSGYLSSLITNSLPFIINTDINYVENTGGNVIQGTDIRFTAEFGDAIVRFGGQLFYDITSANFVIEYPLNKLLKVKSLSNNLIFQFERIVDPFSQNTTQINTSNRIGGLILYKINF